MALESRRGGSYAQLDASLGSFSSFDLQGAVGTKLGPGQFNGAAQINTTKDYRPDSKFDRGTLAGRYSLELTPGSTLAISGRAHSGTWKSASYLLKTQFDAGDTYGKDARVLNDGGSKEFYTGRVDYNLLLAPNLKLLTFAYATQQDYTRFFTRPLNASTWSQREETYHRNVGGAGFSFNGEQRLGGVALQYVAGAEVYRESTDYLFFEGLKARARVAQAVYDRTYDFNSASAFTEMTAVFSPYFKPTLGLRFDRFTGECSKKAETGGDPCSKLNTASRTTPKFGVLSTLAPGLDLRASVAEGFALPPGVAKYAAGGAALQTTVLRQTELGLGYKTTARRAVLTAYRINSSNEVRTVSPGVYENFGRTRRKGIEGSLTVTPLDSLEISAVLNTADAKVLENSNPVLVGKQITSVPKNSATLSAAFRPPAGFGFSAEVHRVANSAVDAPNTLFYGAFTTLDLGAQYVGTQGANRYRAYAKIENAADRKYATNAFLIGGQPLVAPAAPRSFQIGLQADF